jgi:thiosulfate/3-mercaptopyruvate sulfurtransferase
MATPHNIRRKTPQNGSCNACHGNEDLFLREQDVEPKYAAANRTVVVSEDRIPGKVAE